MHNYLPRKYHFISNFDKNHIDNQTSDTAIIFRNYTKKIDLDLILKIKNYCKKRKIKFLISNNIKLAINLNLDGAYIPSFNTSTRHLNYTRSNKFILVGSSHNLKEIRMKELQNVQAIFLSSLFKKNKNYLGVRKFRLLSCLTRIKIIALGGISNNNQKQLKLINCFGFAGISFFNK